MKIKQYKGDVELQMLDGDPFYGIRFQWIQLGDLL